MYVSVIKFDSLSVKWKEKWKVNDGVENNMNSAYFKPFYNWNKLREWQHQLQVLNKLKIKSETFRVEIRYIENIQMFRVNMTFISSNKVKKCIFHLWLCHSLNIHFFTSWKAIFAQKIEFSFDNLYNLLKNRSKSYILLCNVWLTVLSIGSEIYKKTLAVKYIYFCIFHWWKYNFMEICIIF